MQQLITGTGSLASLHTILTEKKISQLLIVAGDHALQDFYFNEFIRELHLPVSIIHPPKGLLQTADIPMEDSVDAVLAIGGGKVIDYAKGIIYKQQSPAYFIAAPTTAGSGSEATPFAVFYDGKQKISLQNGALLPAVVILDPILLDSLPSLQKAISGADAMAQCIESLWSKGCTKESEQHALQGLAILWEYLPAFIKEGSSKQLTQQIQVAANLAGKAIAISRTTGAHALSYYLTAEYQVPHGQAVAILLPLFFLYNHTEATAAQLQKVYDILGVNDQQQAAAACVERFKQMGLDTDLQALQLSDFDMDAMLRSVNHERFNNNPVAFDAARLKTLIREYLL